MPLQPSYPRSPCRHLLRPSCTLFLAFALALMVSAGLRAQSLDGSRTSLVLQNVGAAEEGFSYLRTASQVEEFVELGLLVKLPGNADYELAGVSFPYARDEVKRFVERLGRQYRTECGEPLVVTSLTRPIARQPRNASELSVHPTGMAVDLRRSDRASCRRWLEETLLWLESKGVVEATRERWPPHYHISVFGTPYGRYLASIGEDAPEGRMAIASTSSSHKPSTVRAKSSSSRGKSKSSRAVAKRYKVGRGDNLWQIAKRHGTSVASLKKANKMRSNQLRPGQVLAIPTRTRAR